MPGTSFFQILIKIAKQGTGGDEAVKDLYRLKSQIGTLVGVFGAVTAAAYTVNKVFQATAGEFVSYANQVRGMSQAFSISAEDASRLIQVADDLQISQSALEMALKKMAQNGIEPSIEGLQRLASQYAMIDDPALKAKFLVDQFGKSGLDMAAAMRQGADGLGEMNAAIQQGLILTGQSVGEARAYEVAVDNLNDMWTAFKITIGQEVIPVMNDQLIQTMATKTASEAFFASHSKWGYNVKELDAAIAAEVERLKAEQQALIDAATGKNVYAAATEGQINGLGELVTWAGAAADATEEDTYATMRLADAQGILAAALSGDLQAAYDDYSTNMADLTVEHADLTASLQQLVAWGYGPTSEKVMDLNAKLAENEQKQKDVAKATELATSKMIYQQVAARLDAKGQLELARTLGLISERDYAVASALDTLTQKYDTNKDGVVDAAEGAEQYIQDLKKMKEAIDKLPLETDITVTTTYITEGNPPYIPPENPPVCFLAGTRIATPGGLRAIEEIEAGDEVISRDLESGTEIVTKVVKTFRHENSACHYLINGKLRVTGNHPLHVNNGWMEARNICVGDMLTGRGETREQVITFELVEEQADTFNLEIGDECHNYFAEGVLAHNKIIDNSTAGGSSFYSTAQGSQAGASATYTGTNFSFSGATFHITLSSGASIGEFLQTLMNASGM